MFHESGKLHQEAVPGFYNKEVFDDLIRRVVALFETIDENYLPCDEYVLKYGDINVRLNRNKDCYLMVFVSPDANVMTVKMVSRLAIRNVSLSSLKLSASKPPFRVPAATTEPTPAEPSTKAAPSPRRDDDDDQRRRRHSYRGTKY